MHPRGNDQELYSARNHMVALTTPTTPNYTVSATAGGAILFLAGLDALTGCGGYSTYLELGIGLGFELMAANQYGWAQTKSFITTNSFALFKSVKEALPGATHDEEPRASMKKSQ